MSGTKKSWFWRILDWFDNEPVSYLKEKNSMERISEWRDERIRREEREEQEEINKRQREYEKEKFAYGRAVDEAIQFKLIVEEQYRLEVRAMSNFYFARSCWKNYPTKYAINPDEYPLDKKVTLPKPDTKSIWHDESLRRAEISHKYRTYLKALPMKEFRALAKSIEGKTETKDKVIEITDELRCRVQVLDDLKRIKQINVPHN